MSQPHDHGKEVAHGASHESADHAHHNMHLGLYWGIGGVLVVFTFITVWLSYFDFGSRAANITIGMIVATFKVCLVGAIFMHLKGEKWLIWKFLLFTLFFVAGLFLLTLLNHADPIFGTTHATH